MRCHFQVLALAIASTAQSQSFTGDWRPEDRTVMPSRVFTALADPLDNSLQLNAVRQ